MQGSSNIAGNFWSKFAQILDETAKKSTKLRHPDPGHPDPDHPDLGHPNPGHHDLGHPIPGHPDLDHPNPGHPDPDHPDPGPRGLRSSTRIPGSPSLEPREG
ncbi:unnamed protein product [Caenorhabditis nigoni]